MTAVCLQARSNTTQRDVIRTHFELATAHYGPRRASALMRKFGIKYSRLHPESLAVRDAFVAARNEQEWKAVLVQYYGEDLPGRHPPASPEAAETPGTDETAEIPEAPAVIELPEADVA